MEVQKCNVSFTLVADDLGHKINTASFQQVAVFGVGTMGILAKVLRLKIQDFPLLGLCILILTKALYEVHDENPLLIKLNERFPIMIKVWDYVNHHAVMVLLVFMGILPHAWLLVNSAGYAVAKLSLARGCLEHCSTDKFCSV